MTDETADADATSIEWVNAQDGARIAVKRRRRDGTPVVFLHGIAVHAGIWELPAFSGDEFTYRSLSDILHEAGHDVWLANFRGHGPPECASLPAPGQSDWCLDHFIAYDLPAVIDHVVEQTGRQPFVIASSMGSMTLAGCLQGARLVGEEPPHIEIDESLAGRRRKQLAGCVFFEFPAALRWPRSLYGKDEKLDWQSLTKDWMRFNPQANYPFEVLSRLGWLEAILAAVGEVPLDRFRGGPERLRDRWPRRVTETLDRIEKSFTEGLLKLAGTFNGATHHRAEIFMQTRRHVVESMKAGVLRQLAKSVRRRAFVSDSGAADHVYSDHYGMIDLPLLVVAGGRDRIANAGVTREVFYDAVRSRDKTFRLFEEIAHGEFVAAPVATQRVYPLVREWIAERDRR